eukprot:8809860-Pyramimonas_sp.AAC.1
MGTQGRSSCTLGKWASGRTWNTPRSMKQKVEKKVLCMCIITPSTFFLWAAFRRGQLSAASRPLRCRAETTGAQPLASS